MGFIRDREQHAPPECGLAERVFLKIRFRLMWFLQIGFVLPLLLSSSAAASVQTRSDSHALSRLFDERHIDESGFYFRSRTADLPAEERYEWLAEWVLPGDAHPNFRLGLAFVPTDPSPPVLERFGIAPDRSSKSWTGRLESSRGGYPISPAFDLIAVAAELRKLDEVRSRIEDAIVEGEFQTRCQLALLILTDIAREDYQPAIANLDDLATRLREEAFEEYSQRWPETLAARVGVQQRETRLAASDLLFGMLHNQVRTGYARGPETWDRSVAALGGLLDHYESLKSNSPEELSVPSVPELKQWSPLSRTTALTRGDGFPCPRWIGSPGAIEKIAGHNEDYLMYHSPLRGDFELECDLSYFGWSDSHLSVAGVWVAPTTNQQAFHLGDFRAARPEFELHPPLSLYDEFVHCRVVVHDRICTTYFNGRAVHEEALSELHDPWVAIRSPWNAHTVVRGLRMTGSPEIPKQISLSEHLDLTGWTAYYDEEVGRNGYHWSHDVDLMRNGTIVGRRQKNLAGTAQESLLRYQRPMLEDGTIEYDFYYSPGRVHVHPSLDRRAFLLTPDGVRVHWITDGIYDLTGLDPANSRVEPDCRRGPDRFPLIPGDWNHLKLSVTGDEVDLVLNGQLIYRCELEPTNRRTFGLFHYSDLTEVRVREIVWTGDWPRELPPVREQPWADFTRDFLDDDLDQLEAEYVHDFTKEKFPSRDLIVRGVDWQKHIKPTPRGLRVTTPSFEAYRPTNISPKLLVEGDFDIIAEFEGLETAVSEAGASGITLRVILEDEYEQRSVYRGLVVHPPAPRRQLIESIVLQNVNQKPQMTYEGVTSQEANSGRLRIARRGETVYCLFAERDSPHFQLVSKEPFDAERVRLEGVRLNTATQAKSGSTSVIWKRLSIRAEEILRK